MNKSIVVDPLLLGGKRSKTQKQKKPSGSELKKALLESLSSPDLSEMIEPKPPEHELKT